MIQGIERIDPKLDAKALGNLEGLEGRGVEIEPPWSGKSGAITCQIPEWSIQDASCTRESCGRRCVSRRVEIELARSGVAKDVRSANHVSPLSVVGRMQVVTVCGDVKWRARLPRKKS